MVGDAALRIIVGADSFASVARADLRLAFIGNFLIGDLLIVVVQAGFQDFHCFFAVFYLASFVLADDDHTRGKVRYADCGFRLIYVLTACAARAESVDFQVLVQNFDFDVGGFREHRNRDRRGMHTTLRFGFRARAVRGERRFRI